MPFIDNDRLAELYKEVDEEKKAAVFFQNLHQKNKQRLAQLKWYKYCCVVLFFVLLGGVYVFSIKPFGNKTSGNSLDLSERIEELELENALLSRTTNFQKSLTSQKVFTVQIAVSSNKEIMLFSEHFVNFRAHPLKHFNAYSLGNFSTEEEAEAFRQELIALGLLDVWVTAYQDGKRILIDRNE